MHHFSEVERTYPLTHSARNFGPRPGPLDYQPPYVERRRGNQGLGLVPILALWQLACILSAVRLMLINECPAKLAVDIPLPGILARLMDALKTA
jgi:hypothetical protein